MTIVLTGGGTGGHITPVLAIANELKHLRPDVRVAYIGQKGDKLSDIPEQHPAIDAVYGVRAGKFRRYHGEGWKQLLDLRTQALNVRDTFRVLVGIWQSYWLLGRLHPSIIFTRGGYVSVPVAVAGKLRGIAYITHDSDSTPSLANRLIARWALLHAVALPPELYPYPKDKTIMVGVPVAGEYQPVSQQLQHQYREGVGLPATGRVLLVTGGGNGARDLNDLVVRTAPTLLARFPDLVIVHIAGRALEDEAITAYDKVLDASVRGRAIVKGFVGDLYRYSGAADVIIARGGATGLAEWAVQEKACIVIPAPQLIWQSHHASVLAKEHAIIMLDEKTAAENGSLAQAVGDLLEHTERRAELAHRLASLGHPDAARRAAMLLLEKSR